MGIQKIVIDDGTREIPIYNMYDEKICTIRLRPADISIMDRFNDLQKALGGMFEPLTQISIKNDGTADTEDEWTVLKGVEAELIAQLNKLLDTADAAAIFEKRNAFSSVGGKFFCEHVIDALGELIANAIKEETTRTNKKISKYIPAEDEKHDRTTADEPDGVRNAVQDQV